MARSRAAAKLERAWGRDDDLTREAIEIIDQLQGTFSDRNELYERIDSIVFQSLPVSIPKAYQKTSVETRSPLATHIANTVTAALSYNGPKVSFEPTSFGDSARENSTLRERFFEASRRRQEEDARRRLFRVFMYSLVTKGEGILKTMARTERAWREYARQSTRLAADLDAKLRRGEIDAEAREQLYDVGTDEYKRGAPYPIVMTDVPPESFYYQKGENGITLAAEVKYIPYLDALAQYAGRFGLSSDGRIVPAAMGLARPDAVASLRSTHGLLRMYELWDWEYVTYILLDPKGGSQSKSAGGGMVVRRIKHGYGDPETKALRGPYFHALGLTTASRLPERAGLSVLFPYLDLFPLLDSLLTIESNAAFLFGFPAFKEKLPPTAIAPGGAGGVAVEPDTGEDEEPDRIEPGRIYPYDIEPVEQPRAGVELDKLLARLQGMLESALPAVMSGSLSGDPSGYAFNQASYMARLAWQPIVDNAEFALSEQVGFESWLIENKVGERVYVWGDMPNPGARGATRGWLGVGPKDLRGVHRYQVKLDPETPSTKVIQVRMYGDMLDRKLIGPYTAIQELGGNPDEVEREWYLYELKQAPEIKAALLKRTFQKLGLADQQAMGGPEAAQAALAGAFGPMPGDVANPNSLGNIGQVFQPGQNGQPLMPTTAGTVTGSGPGGGGGGTPGPVPGAPTVQQAPAQHQPLPGEGPVR